MLSVSATSKRNSSAWRQKAVQPDSYQCFRLPRHFWEKSIQSWQLRTIVHLVQEPSEGPRLLIEHWPQQYGHEVLELRLREPLTELFYKMAQTYNRNWHRVPPWSQGFQIHPLVPYGVPCFNLPSQKCKHRVTITTFAHFDEAVNPSKRSIALTERPPPCSSQIQLTIAVPTWSEAPG